MLTSTDYNLTEAEFKKISDMVYKYCGINLHDGKMELVRARIAKRLRANGCTSVAEYIDRVLDDTSGEEFAVLIDAMSTNLTSFFRENDHFIHLTNKFLPPLITKRRNRRIRVWSAGCSSGEEPYTLAMVLHDAFKNKGTWDIKILATDISTQVLRAARQGMYSPERLKNIPLPMRKEYFQEVHTGGQIMHQVTPVLRDMIAFNRLNLMEKWPFSGPFDFIFCRNVMIYFDKPTQERLVNRYYDCLEDGGLLFTGHSESLTGIRHRFKYVEPTIYGKQ